jgi:predicted nucleic acid-binding protein
MTVVADTSPLCYLVLIGRLDLLKQVFGQVAIPPAVIVELGDPEAPDSVRELAASLPPWIRVENVTSAEPALARLHPGEREAILLAEQLHADLVIIDDVAARETARSRCLSVTGLLGVLSRSLPPRALGRMSGSRQALI